MPAPPTKPRILILIGAHLSTAPRPQKEAVAAQREGLHVAVRGHWWSDRLAIEDVVLARQLGINFEAITDQRRGRPKYWRLKILKRSAQIGFRLTGRFSPRLLCAGARETLATALKYRADLTIVHSESGLWVADKLRASGLRVAVDFEDWFSEDMAVEDRKGRPGSTIKDLERSLLHNANATWTTSQALAQALAADAGNAKVPEVIPNCCPFEGAPAKGALPKDARSPDALSLYWFSQTIGPHRGLEVLAEALLKLNGSWELHLRGELRHHLAWFHCTFAEAIKDRIHVHAPSTNADLASLTASHDVGLALEIPSVPSRDLTITNKLFEYFRCGLAVVATDTQGQKEVMHASQGTGQLVPHSNPTALAEALQNYIDDKVALKQAKRAAREVARTLWNWDGYGKRLANIIVAASQPQSS